MSKSNGYAVVIGFEVSKQGGVGGHVDFEWNGEISDVDITKKKKSSRQCEWKIDVNDWREAATSTISFEPGGTFRIAASEEKLCCTSKYILVKYISYR